MEKSRPSILCFACTPCSYRQQLNIFSYLDIAHEWNRTIHCYYPVCRRDIVFSVFLCVCPSCFLRHLDLSFPSFSSRYSSQMCELFTEVYNCLPLAHCLASKILVCVLITHCLESKIPLFVLLSHLCALQR